MECRAWGGVAGLLGVVVHVMMVVVGGVALSPPSLQ